MCNHFYVSQNNSQKTLTKNLYSTCVITFMFLRITDRKLWKTILLSFFICVTKNLYMHMCNHFYVSQNNSQKTLKNISSLICKVLMFKTHTTCTVKNNFNRYNLNRSDGLGICLYCSLIGQWPMQYEAVLHGEQSPALFTMATWVTQKVM